MTTFLLVYVAIMVTGILLLMLSIWGGLRAVLKILEFIIVKGGLDR